MAYPPPPRRYTKRIGPGCVSSTGAFFCRQRRTLYRAIYEPRREIQAVLDTALLLIIVLVVAFLFSVPLPTRRLAEDADWADYTIF